MKDSSQKKGIQARIGVNGTNNKAFMTTYNQENVLLCDPTKLRSREQPEENSSLIRLKAVLVYRSPKNKLIHLHHEFCRTPESDRSEGVR